MSKLPRVLETKWALVTALGIITLPAAGAGSAYLPRIGPKPIRLAIAKPASSHAIEMFAAAIQNKKNAASVIEPIVTNVIEKVAEVAPLMPVEKTEVKSQAPTAVEPFPVESTSADNLLTITPKMLTEFFTPVAGATNHTSVLVVQPAEMEFRPPSPKETPSSRATYTSE